MIIIVSFLLYYYLMNSIVVAKKENVQIRKCQIHSKHFCEEHSHWQCGSHPIPSSPPESVSTPTALAASAKRPPPKRARCLGEQMGWLHKTAPFKKKGMENLGGLMVQSKMKDLHRFLGTKLAFCCWRGFICPSWCRILLINSIGFRFGLC